MKKKVISILLIIIMLISSFALSITAFASSQLLYLDQMATASINGVGDLEWFYFTPDQSGLYSFLSFNTPKCEAYLTVRERNPETGQKEIVTLAYAGPESDPDYENNGHNKFQFILTYHLEAGTTYYFGAGWTNPAQTWSQFNVMLRLDSYDSNAIESVELSNIPDLIAYDGGELRIDGNGRSYYHYDISRVIRNSTVTINYSNGTSSSATGVETLDGYNISYIDNQYEHHWYPQADENYTENTISIKVLDKTATGNVNVVIGAKYYVKGKVVNLAGKPVENALINFDGSNVAYTDKDGVFAFYSSTGVKNVTISTDTSINLTTKITVGSSELDMSDTPFALCNCEYVKDGYINAKDYYYIIHNFSGSTLEEIKDEYKNAINFTKDRYK